MFDTPDWSASWFTVLNAQVDDVCRSSSGKALSFALTSGLNRFVLPFSFDVSNVSVSFIVSPSTNLSRCNPLTGGVFFGYVFGKLQYKLWNRAAPGTYASTIAVQMNTGSLFIAFDYLNGDKMFFIDDVRIECTTEMQKITFWVECDREVVEVWVAEGANGCSFKDAVLARLRDRGHTFDAPVDLVISAEAAVSLKPDNNGEHVFETVDGMQLLNAKALLSADVAASLLATRQNIVVQPCQQGTPRSRKRARDELGNVYQVKVVIRGSKMKRGLYEGEDLHIRLNFASMESAMRFSAALDLWPMNHCDPLGLNGTIEIEDPKALEVAKPGRVVRLSHYKGADSDSPVQNLDEFRASVSSLSMKGVSRTDPLATYQSLEKPEKFASLGAYRLHIKDKARFPALANDENNMFAGSWTPFHQAFDHLNSTEPVPLLAIRPSPGIETEMAPILKHGTEKIGDLIYRSFVDVKNPDLFKQCLLWKWEWAQKLWEADDRSGDVRS
eukprot:m51a1_g1448 hypothetical protein (499) ;mRNA; r:146749-149068